MTLLNYAFLPSPDPLQAGDDATLTLVVSNPGGKAVTVKSIVVTLPVGTAARALTPDATGIQAEVPAGWSASPPAAAITFTPSTPEAAEVGPNGVTFIFARVAVNAQPGTASVAIDETASNDAQPTPRERTATPSLDKFPRQFSVSGLTASPLRVDQGGSSTLMWTGTPADYRLYYDPGTGPVDAAVGASGPYVAAGLQRAAGVSFTLTVSVRVPGQDQPLVVQRTAHVDVAAVAIDAFVASPSTVGVNGLTRLSWRTSGAASVTLDPGNITLPASGVRFEAVAPGQGTFTLTARGNRPEWTQQQQRTVTVDASIVATEAGHVKVGAPGKDGEDGRFTFPFSHNGENGTAGGQGEDVALTLTLPALESSSRPTRVVPITLGGGRGGRGGNGAPGYRGPLQEDPTHGGNGADGARGGHATLDATVGDGRPPAQYLVKVTPGTGGAPGTEGYGDFPGFPGRRGPDGTVSVTFRETRAQARPETSPPDAAAWTLHPLPDPLPAGAAGARLALVGAEPAGERVTVSFPVGAGAGDLTADPASIVATAPPGWRVTGEGGAFTFVAERGAPPPVFVFDGIRVNDKPGVCQVHVDGLALPLARFPAGFAVSPLAVSPARVPGGGAAVLAWSGSPGAEYELRWDPGTGPVARAVANAGSFAAGDLTALPGVAFTLTATLPGGLVIERRAFVEVEE